jgi:hypothetical protein
MSTKNNPGKYDCYAAALSDEPMFVLLARDLQAPKLIEAWARDRRSRVLAGECPQSDMGVVKDAEDVARDMIEWRRAHEGHWRLPALHRFIVSVKDQIRSQAIDVPSEQPIMAAWHVAATLVSMVPCEIVVMFSLDDPDVHRFEFGFSGVDGTTPYVREIAKR